MSRTWISDPVCEGVTNPTRLVAGEWSQLFDSDQWVTADAVTVGAGDVVAGRDGRPLTVDAPNGAPVSSYSRRDLYAADVADRTAPAPLLWIDPADNTVHLYVGPEVVPGRYVGWNVEGYFEGAEGRKERTGSLPLEITVTQ